MSCVTARNRIYSIKVSAPPPPTDAQENCFKRRIKIYIKLYTLSTLYLCVLYLSENKQRLVPLTDKLIGFYNRDEKCLQRGTDWGFK